MCRKALALRQITRALQSNLQLRVRARRCICDAGGKSAQEVCMRNNGGFQSPLRSLRKDLYAVARDAEALLKATADVTNDRVQEVRTRTEKTVRAAMDTLSNDELRNRVRRVAETTDE